VSSSFPRHQDDRLVHQLDDPFEKGLGHEGQFHAPEHLPRELEERPPRKILLRDGVLGQKALLFERLQDAEGRALAIESLWRSR
jgi:hypothetical protein